jgi:hypothetical protein
LKYALAIKDRFIEANDRVWIKPESWILLIKNDRYLLLPVI